MLKIIVKQQIPSYSGRISRLAFPTITGALLLFFINGILVAQSPRSPNLKVVEEYGRKSQDRNLLALINEYRSKTSERIWQSDGGKYTLRGRYSHFNLVKNQVTLIGEDGKPRDVPISKLTEDDAVLVQRIAEIEVVLPFAALEDATGRLEKTGLQVQSLEKSLQDSSQQIELLNKQLSDANKYAPSKRIESANGIVEVDSKRLETFGSEFVGKQVRFTNAKWIETTTSWITSLPNVQVSSNGLLTRYDAKAADRWVGFRFVDSKGEYFGYAFASKAEWGEFLLNLERNQPINLVGTVIKLEKSNDFGVIAFAIEKSAVTKNTSEPVSKNTWKLETKTDPITDSTSYVLNCLFKGEGSEEYIFLIIRYQENALEVFLATKEKLQTTPDGKIRCVVRFGEEPPAEVMASPSTSGDSAFFEPESLLSGMLRSARITIQAPTSTGGKVTAVYDLTEFKDKFQPIQNAIGIQTSGSK